MSIILIHVHINDEAGIGKNVSCTLGDSLSSNVRADYEQPRELWFSIYSCMCIDA